MHISEISTFFILCSIKAKCIFGNFEGKVVEIAQINE
jgi:hypothetical protein